MTEVLHQAGCPGAGDPFIRWGYDEVGNRLTETRPAGTTTYSYDNADQLTQQSGLGGTVTYGYDANGNQLAKGSRTFTYDLNDRLVSTTAAGTTITYGYDGDGKRLLESDSTSTTRFLWDANQPLPELAIERNGAGTLLRRYHHGLSLISMRNGAGADFYYHPDGLGSTANLTDANGATQWTYEYEPYGAERVATPAPGAPVNRIRYTGAYLDTDTGLYHLRARQYDPTTGRFLATDPLAADVADPYVAAYVYAMARPGVLTDPTGLTPGDWNPTSAGSLTGNGMLGSGVTIPMPRPGVSVGVGRTSVAVLVWYCRHHMHGAWLPPQHRWPGRTPYRRTTRAIGRTGSTGSPEC